MYGMSGVARQMGRRTPVRANKCSGGVGYANKCSCVRTFGRTNVREGTGRGSRDFGVRRPNRCSCGVGGRTGVRVSLVVFILEMWGSGVEVLGETWFTYGVPMTDRSGSAESVERSKRVTADRSGSSQCAERAALMVFAWVQFPRAHDTNNRKQDPNVLRNHHQHTRLHAG